MAGEPVHQSLIRVGNRRPEMGFKTLSVALFGEGASKEVINVK